MQAQVTALHLTNWAGRAFRRAIKEANGGDAYNNSAGEVQMMTTTLIFPANMNIQQKLDFTVLTRKLVS
jgi:hypothetical protein